MTAGISVGLETRSGGKAARVKIPNHMYIDGQGVEAVGGGRIDIIDPATEKAVDSVPVAAAGPTDCRRCRAISPKAPALPL